MRELLQDQLAYLVRSIPPSRQVRDPFEGLYTPDEITPPYPLEQLLMVAEQHAVHAACLRAKADDAVGRGWRLKARGERAVDDPARVAEELERICGDWSFAELLVQAAWELEALGWAAWEVAREGNRIAALYPLPAHTLRATRDPNRYVQVRGMQKVMFRAFGAEGLEGLPEVIIFRWYSPRSSYYGLPRWLAAIPALTELAAIREYNLSWFASGGMADRLITVSAPTLDEAAEAARKIEDGLRQARGRGHVSLVVELSPEAQTTVQWLSPQVSQREGQFMRRREDLLKEILMAHGVPPYRIGWAEIGALQGAAAREMLHAYRLGVIEPLQTVFEARLNATLFGPQGLGLTDQWVLDDLDWEETELHLQVAMDGVKHGVLTPNEARQLLGHPPAEDPALDQYYRQQSLIPLSATEDVHKALDVIQELRAALAATLEAPDAV